MAAPPSLSRVNRSVGVFVVVAGLILIITFGQAARFQRWFTPGKRVSVLLPARGSFGLRAGADVIILGTLAGRVLHVGFDEDAGLGSMKARIEIRSDFEPLVCQDSTATIRRRFSVAGDAFMDISRGNGEPLPERDAVIRATADEAPTELLQVLLDEVRGSVIPAISEARIGIDAWTNLGLKLQDDDGDAMVALARLRSISEGIDRGQGTVGRLVRDEALAERIERITTDLHETIAGLRPAVENLSRASADLAEFARVARGESTELPGLTRQARDALARLDTVLTDVQAAIRETPALVRDLRDASAALPSLVLQAQQTLREAERFIAGMQQHWLFRRSMPAEAPTTLAPGEVAR